MRRRVMRVKMARWRRHMDSLVSGAWAWCLDILEFLVTIAVILVIAVPAGIGFGWGLALAAALI